MANEDPGQTDKPLPHCKALLLCEKVTESQLTGKITLHNLIETFGLRRYPGQEGQLLARQQFLAEVEDGSE